jgi:hypothetical protein
MKTAMQELLKHICNKGVKNYPLDTLELIEGLLEKEKEQIKDAFNKGMFSSSDYFNPANPTLSESLNYYKETYKK